LYLLLDWYFEDAWGVIISEALAMFPRFFCGEKELEHIESSVSKIDRIIFPLTGWQNRRFPAKAGGLHREGKAQSHANIRGSKAELDASAHVAEERQREEKERLHALEAASKQRDEERRHV
jgi:hypothetical protein